MVSLDCAGQGYTIIQAVGHISETFALVNTSEKPAQPKFSKREFVSVYVSGSENEAMPLSPANHWRRQIRPTLKEQGLDWVSFQVLRRSCSSLLNDAGIDGKLVSQQLGHTLDVNQNVYTTVGKTDNKQRSTRWITSSWSLQESRQT